MIRIELFQQFFWYKLNSPISSFNKNWTATTVLLVRIELFYYFFCWNLNCYNSFHETSWLILVICSRGMEFCHSAFTEIWQFKATPLRIKSFTDFPSLSCWNRISILVYHIDLKISGHIWDGSSSVHWKFQLHSSYLARDITIWLHVFLVWWLAVSPASCYRSTI